MGTRNLTKVVDENGVTKVAQYGQWDGYPSGQGVIALFHATHNLALIKKGLGKCRWISDEEAEEIYKLFPDMNYVGTMDGEKFGLYYPNLTRDTGAEILGVVAYSIGELPLVDNSEFEQDELYCEAVYTIDFSINKFIATWDGHSFHFPLDNLPSPEVFVATWNTTE